MILERGGRALHVALLTLLAAGLVYCAWFRLDGGRWERVESPSMGTTAPVGTLVWAAPVDPHRIRVGDIVSFRPPGSAIVYTHRVRAVLADGSLETGGDLSGPDQWRIPPSRVLGRIVHVWPGAGWLVEAAPLLALGSLLTLAVIRLRRRSPQIAIVLIGSAMTLAAVLVVYRPLTAAQQIGLEQVSEGARATFVSTGLLPVRLETAGAAPVQLGDGQAGSVLVVSRSGGRGEVSLSAAVPLWFWAAVGLLTFGPALGLSVSRAGRRLLRPGRATPGRHRSPGTRGVPARTLTPVSADLPVVPPVVAPVPAVVA